MKCNVPECREDLKKCINNGLKKKISTTTLAIILTAIIAAGGTIATMSYDAYSEGRTTRQADIKQNREAVARNTLNMATIKADLNNMKETLSESRATQTKIFDVLNEINRKLVK